MYFEEYGDRNNTTLIMLHGATMVHCFTRQLCLADHYHLVIPHIYGNGRESEVLFDKDKTVHDIIKLIEGFGKDKVNLVGFSIGAQLIIPIVCQAGKLIGKAIFVSPCILKSNESIEKSLKSLKIMYPLTKNKWVSKMIARGLCLDISKTQEFIDYNSRMRRENLAAFVKGVVNINDYPQFKDVEIPMLVIAGKSETADMLKSVEYIRQINRNCINEIWENCGHNIPIKNGDRFCKTITGFIV
jgi:pimeloyl-ACP methyl ester carboxylesterase